jgi:hydrogenase nickel incorporation protein HypA/HybF
MHELSIALSILDAVAAEAERHGGARVHAIHLKVGALAGVVPEALRSAYELAREGSPFAEAQLLIEEVPIVAYCAHCEADRPVVSVQQLQCSECGGAVSEVLSGRELEIVALEIE